MLSAAISGIYPGIYPSTASESSGWARCGTFGTYVWLGPRCEDRPSPNREV